MSFLFQKPWYRILALVHAFGYGYRQEGKKWNKSKHKSLPKKGTISGWSDSCESPPLNALEDVRHAFPWLGREGATVTCRRCRQHTCRMLQRAAASLSTSAFVVCKELLVSQDVHFFEKSRKAFCLRIETIVELFSMLRRTILQVTNGTYALRNNSKKLAEKS